jgi:hypothetical protein
MIYVNRSIYPFFFHFPHQGFSTTHFASLTVKHIRISKTINKKGRGRKIEKKLQSFYHKEKKNRNNNYQGTYIDHTTEQQGS